MLDDLRKSSAFIDEDELDEEEETHKRKSHKPSHFMGMSALQRFIISVLLLMMVLVLGVFALILSGSVAIF